MFCIPAGLRACGAAAGLSAPMEGRGLRLVHGLARLLPHAQVVLQPAATTIEPRGQGRLLEIERPATTRHIDHLTTLELASDDPVAVLAVGIGGEEVPRLMEGEDLAEWEEEARHAERRRAQQRGRQVGDTVRACE